MISELNETPKAMRLHIGVFGSTNAGKSTLINLISGQEIALTSPVAGTTTDPVFKPLELLPLGPIVLIDTAGLDDDTELGGLREKKTMAQLDACDAAIYLISSEENNIKRVKEHIEKITKAGIPVILVINKFNDNEINFDFSEYSFKMLSLNLSKKESALPVKEALIEALKDKIEEPVLTGDLVKSGDIVILVCPQDVAAPKGRLILPEVEVERDLLDNDCIVITVPVNQLEKSLESLKEKPSLVITDSQVYKKVSDIVPEDIKLTSFSMLMAKIKGDISSFIRGAKAIDTLQDGDKVMILESCAHHIQDDDIARVKIPRLLRKYTGKNLEIIAVSGQNFTERLDNVKLAIHCGGCMVNRKSMLAKQKKFEDMGIPITNFGVAIAYMNGIINRVCY